MIRIVFILIAIITLLVRCKKNEEQKESENNLARREHVVEKNPVEVVVLIKKMFKKQLMSNGRIEAIQKCSLNFLTSGTIEKVNISNGDRVFKGQTLAQLANEDAESRLSNAQISLRQAEIDLKDKYLQYGYKLEQIDEVIPEVSEVLQLRSGYFTSRNNVESAKREYERCNLKAPFTGVIADLNIKPYEKSSDMVCTVIDDSRFKVKFVVLETELEFITKGQESLVSPFFDTELELKGKITAINPTVSDNGQIAIIAELPNNGKLIDGMNVKIKIELDMPNQMVVPKSAVLIRDGYEVLFKYVNGLAEWTYVNVLVSNSTHHSIISNTARGAELNVGDSIIVSGNLNLGNNTEVHLTD